MKTFDVEKAAKMYWKGFMTELCDTALRPTFRKAGKCYMNPIICSWGYTKPTCIAGQLLRFEVSGYLHNGYVYIALDWNDTFEIYLVSYSNEVKRHLQTVYFDELIEKQDSVIEKEASLG